jgi:hypothetical protein
VEAAQTTKTCLIPERQCDEHQSVFAQQRNHQNRGRFSRAVSGSVVCACVRTENGLGGWTLVQGGMWRLKLENVFGRSPMVAQSFV